jgi:ACS family tartrate transporter-like MFS transporter
MPTPSADALDRARAKAYIRLIPLLFLCYVIAYVDRVNVGFAKLQMQPDLAPLGFSESAFGFGMGVFFIGYLALEIPGTLIVERWSARKWISRIMISWGIVAAMTAFVHYEVPGVTQLARFTVVGLANMLEPIATLGLGEFSRRINTFIGSLREPGAPFVLQFFSIRFLLGLAEAGFYPGVIVYLTHWFPYRDRTKALSGFLIGTPVAAIVGPLISEQIMTIGTAGNPTIQGLVGWQWVFIIWGIPAVLLGITVLAFLTDRPSDAAWLTAEEREALESTLKTENADQKRHSKHFTIVEALTNLKTLALALAYFCVVTGSYGIELYMASIVKDWYGLDVKHVMYLIIIPGIGALIGQLVIGWNSDRTCERKWHAAIPIMLGSAAIAFIPGSEGTKWLTVTLFTLAMVGMKAFLPAFWALPSLLLTESAAAASIGLINSCGNLGGWVGPSVIGAVKQGTGEYRYGLWFLSASVISSAVIILCIRVWEQPAVNT